MRYLIFSDIHWNTTTSIVRTIGDTYTTRLESLVKSINWVNYIAKDQNCDAMICAGDFFDRSDLDAQEATALRDIEWNNLPCYFLCGNHESDVADLRFNMLKVLESPNFKVISQPFVLEDDKAELRFLPYITETDRKPLADYFNNSDTTKPKILISHNDVQGINYGGYMSTVGIPLDEFIAEYDLVLNGHIHNSAWLDDGHKVLNVGSFMAHNFTNDSSKYKYGVWILDTNKQSLDFIENPYGFKFYKIDIESKKDFAKLDVLDEQSVVQIKCLENVYEDLMQVLNSIKVLNHRVIIYRNVTDEVGEVGPVEEFTSDYLPKFCTFIKTTLGDTDVVKAELAEICK